MTPKVELPNNVKDIVNKTQFTLEDLVEILKYLRSENGCPWDRAQTHESIEINLIEEAYELVDAIEKKDDEKMIEETGDVLLQAVFHAVLGEERNAFSMQDAINGECIKLITRHTHIFGEDLAKNEKDALSTWEKNKYQEKSLESASQRVSDVPKVLPALLRCEKIQKRASKFNYDRSEEEYKAEIINLLNDDTLQKDDNFAGKLLFNTVAYLRKCNLETENSLKKTTEKFVDVFSKVDSAIAKDGKKINEIDKNQLIGYYNAVKKD